MKQTIFLVSTILTMIASSCWIGKCDLEDQTFFIAEGKRLVYNQGDELMFVSNHLDTLYFEVSIEHGFDTNNPDESGYCTHIVWEYEYYKYFLNIIPEKSNNTEFLPTTNIIIYGSSDPSIIYFDWEGSMGRYMNIVRSQEIETYKITISGKYNVVKAYYLEGNLIEPTDDLFHEYYGFLGFILGQDSLVLQNAPFYDEVIDKEIIIKQ